MDLSGYHQLRVIAFFDFICIIPNQQYSFISPLYFSLSHSPQHLLIRDKISCFDKPNAMSPEIN